jgi:NAD(P)H dehydrogenase (quinone)
MIVVTGASGKLGHLVIEGLLQKVPAGEIVAAARHPDRAKDIAPHGVQVRQADYDQPDTLDKAFQRADKLLLISSSEVGRRTQQHRAAIEAAKRTGVKLIAYTSILHADTSPMPLAAEHRETEALLKASGVPFVLLRNGWYTENYLAMIPMALKHGVFVGSAGDGRISSGARADYAEGAVAVLTRDDQAGRVYELAGDESYTLAEFAAEISRQSGKQIVYQNLPEAEFKEALIKAGLSDAVATMLAESDVGASKGGLFDDSHQLSQLIGHPTTRLATLVKAALSGK